MSTTSKNRGVKREASSSKKIIETALAVIIKVCESNRSEDLDPVLGYARNGDIPRLFEWADHVGTVVYPTAARHYAANQLAALILKYEWPKGSLNIDPPEVTAKRKFLAAEQRNKVTNRRLRVSITRSRYEKYLAWASKWIEKVIGNEPDLPEIYSMCNFSTGSNVGLHGKATNLFRKIEAQWSVSPSASVYFRTALLHNEQFRELFYPEHGGYRCFDDAAMLENVDRKIKHVTYNEVSFVPKNAKSHRTIAIEPVGNSFIQSGIAKAFEQRLRRFGIDLSTQEKNQYLAKVGSITGELATLDLSSASDLVALVLAKRILPSAWYSLLDCTRSPCYSLESGVSQRYEKFVSMGNNFCFPLQTLIYASLVKSVQAIDGCAGPTAVYGDDIICPVTAFAQVVKVFSFCGFKVNTEKTFATGPFRESCGADWYEGQDVRPVTMDKPLVALSDRIIFHNTTLRSARPKLFFTELREWLRASTPRALLRPPIGERVDKAGSYSQGFLNRLPPHTVWSIFSKVHGDEYVSLKTAAWGHHKLERLILLNANGAFTVELDEFMGSSCAKWDRETQSWRWKEQRFIAVPDASSSALFHRAQYLAKLQSSGAELNLRFTTRRVVTLV